MFQKLKNPDKFYTHLKLEIWYKIKDGYFLELQKVKYINGIYSYSINPNESEYKNIKLDYRKRRNTYKLNEYNVKMLTYAQQITELFEQQKFNELNKLVNDNIGEII